MTKTVTDAFKDFEWQKIIDYANSLSDLNDAQLRFIKGLAIELAVEAMSNSDLTYVGQKHKDFDWPSQGVSVELKSVVSQRMYNKDRKSTRLNSSHT